MSRLQMIGLGHLCLGYKSWVSDIHVKATPTSFKKHIQDALNVIKNKDVEHQILFLRSWNEWGEGNYVEPDLKYGHAFLDAIKETIV